MTIIKDNWRFSNDEVKLISKVIKSGVIVHPACSKNKVVKNNNRRDDL